MDTKKNKKQKNLTIADNIIPLTAMFWDFYKSLLQILKAPTFSHSIYWGSDFAQNNVNLCMTF